MIFVALVIGAVVSVLGFGGVPLWAFAPAQVLIVLAAVLEFWKRGFPRVGLPTRALLGLLLALPIVQLLSLPGALIAGVSPALDQLRSAFVPILGADAFASTLSISPYDTERAFLRLACYVLVFLLGFRTARTRRTGELLLQTLIGIGLFEAAYGLIQYLADWQYIFTYKKTAYLSEATGTYVNRNHFAGLLEMVLPFVAAQILFSTSQPGYNLRSLIVSPRASRLLLKLVILMTLGTALVFSRSRMGLLAGTVGVLVVVAIAFLQTHWRSLLPVFLMIFSIPAAYSVWVGLDPVLERFEDLDRPETLEASRLGVWRDSVAIIRDYPLAGTGLGTYRWANRRYQSSRFHLVSDHAHNDYLEFAAEIGIPAALLLFLGLWVLEIRVAMRALSLRSVRERILAAGCAGAMAAILMHGITDFNLQIPANAFIFSWIAGTAAFLVRAHSGTPAPERLVDAVEAANDAANDMAE